MAYLVYCRECGWMASDPVELKGEANWLAGRHISENGHSVALKEIDPDAPTRAEDDIEFYRQSLPDVRIEILRPVSPNAPDGNVGSTRRCGPIHCYIETVQPARS